MTILTVLAIVLAIAIVVVVAVAIVRGVFDASVGHAHERTGPVSEARDV